MKYLRLLCIAGLFNALSLICLHATDGPLLRGGYTIGERATVLLQWNGQSIWLQEGVPSQGLLVNEVGPQFSYVLVEVEGEIVKADLATHTDQPIPIWTARPPQAVDGGKLDECVAILRSSMEANGLTPEQIELGAADLAAKMTESPLERALREGKSLNTELMSKLAAEEAALGTFLLWVENPDGSISQTESVCWPTEFTNDPVTGKPQLIQVSEEKANAYFAARAEKFNRAYNDTEETTKE